MEIIAIMKVSLETIIVLSAVVIPAYAATLSPVGVIYICPGQPQIFHCSVNNQGSSAHLEWRIEFEDSRSMASVVQEYTTSDSASNEEQRTTTRDVRNGVSFISNVTSNVSSSLQSSMTITVDDDNGTTVINNATVYCGQESDPKAVIRVLRVPTSSQMKLTQKLNQLMRPDLKNNSANLMTLCWNQVDMADHYIIIVSSAVQSDSTFFTSNTSIQLTLLYNQEYNVSVIASNCAGNSTPAFLLHISNITPDRYYCNTSTTGLNIIAENNSSGVEVGSQINFYCQYGLVPSNGQNMTATCMSNGTWSPSLHSLKCSKKTKSDISNAGVLIPTLTVSLLVFSIFTFFAGLLLGILCVRCFLKTLNNKNNSSTATSTTPVYEEVLPEITTAQLGRDPDKFVQNKAYESIMINN